MIAKIGGRFLPGNVFFMDKCICFLDNIIYSLVRKLLCVGEQILVLLIFVFLECIIFLITIVLIHTTHIYNDKKNDTSLNTSICCSGSKMGKMSLCVHTAH